MALLKVGNVLCFACSLSRLTRDSPPRRPVFCCHNKHFSSRLNGHLKILRFGLVPGWFRCSHLIQVTNPAIAFPVKPLWTTFLSLISSTTPHPIQQAWASTIYKHRQSTIPSPLPRTNNRATWCKEVHRPLPAPPPCVVWSRMVPAVLAWLAMHRTRRGLRSRFVLRVFLTGFLSIFHSPTQVAQRKLQLVVDPRAHNNYICEHHKQIIQSIRTSGKRNKRKEDEAGLDDDGSMHDFNGNNDSSNDTMHSMGLSSVCSLNALPMNALRRYKRHFRISTKPGSNKTQLAEVSSLINLFLFHFDKLLFDSGNVTTLQNNSGERKGSHQCFHVHAQAKWQQTGQVKQRLIAKVGTKSALIN